MLGWRQVHQSSWNLLMQSPACVFPSYTRAERRTDNSIHVVGVLAAPLACVWLLLHASGAALTGSLIVYCIGLVAMLWASALYNMLPATPWKAVARRADHAVIFFMIAGTYTPLTVNRLPWPVGLPVGIFVWLTAATGAALALAYPHRFEGFKMALYLVSGWAIIIVAGPLSAATSGTTIMLLLAGGIAYSVGAVIHHLHRLQFHNAIWHGLVLLAATLHFIAMKIEFVH